MRPDRNHHNDSEALRPFINTLRLASIHIRRRNDAVVIGLAMLVTQEIRLRIPLLFQANDNVADVVVPTLAACVQMIGKKDLSVEISTPFT